MLLKKIMRKMSGLILVLAIISIWAVYSYENQSIQTSSPVLSNQKISWGIKRANDHKQPDLGSKNKALIDKYEGYAMGNSEKKYIYLTFDNGYEAGYTEKILDVLKENNVKAVFFITAHYLNSAGDIVKRMIDEGHVVRKSYSFITNDTNLKS